MTREIKFRAWDKKENKFEGHFQIAPNGVLAMFDPMTASWGKAEEDRFIVMQYTGLKDKNGKEIYEGDIIDNEGARQKYEVIFHNGCFCISRGPGYHIFNEKKVEIIGNIYEHPNY